MLYLVDVVLVDAGHVERHGAALEGHGPRLQHELRRAHDGAALRHGAAGRSSSRPALAAARAARTVQPH